MYPNPRTSAALRARSRAYWHGSIGIDRNALEQCFAKDGSQLHTIVELQRPLYKYVDKSVLKSVLAGSTKFGLIRSYAELENGRDDDGEGRASWLPQRVSLNPAENKAELEQLAGIGLVWNGSIEIHGKAGAIAVEYKSPNHLCYCMSTSAKSKVLLDAGNQVVLEMRNPERFILSAMRSLGVELAAFGNVIYWQKVTCNDNVPDPNLMSPFVKAVTRADGYRFIDEREFRIIFPDHKIEAPNFIYHLNQNEAPFFEMFTKYR